jgi:Right handed beta helix region
MVFAWTLTVAIAPAASASGVHGAILKVPSQYPTIQSAINAANPGDTILVGPGTYTEPLTIDKSVNLVGAGASHTFLLDAGVPYLIEIGNAASVSFSGFSVTVTTPGADAILVFDGANAVIFGNTIVAAGTFDTGIEVSYYTLGPATATITANDIIAAASPSDGTQTGIFVFGGAQATISHNVIQGPGNVGVIMEYSSGIVTHNIISQFGCEYSPSEVAAGECGPNFAFQFQGAGVADFSDDGLGTTISYNLITRTDAGIWLAGGTGTCSPCVIDHNVVVGSFAYGLLGSDGNFAFGQNVVIGGLYAIGSIAITVDTTVTLSHVVMVGQSAAPPPYYYEDACFEIFGYTCTESVAGT